MKKLLCMALAVLVMCASAGAVGPQRGAARQEISPAQQALEAL